MEDLNKNQIILLALLVSFVAAVATSIMTYSLLNEAPPTVTQTINRVVERTVETVVPQEKNTVTRETVIVKEEDLVIDAIAKNKENLARVWQSPTGQQDELARTFLGIGLIANKEGFIVLKKSSDFVSSGSFEANLPNGQVVPLTFVKTSENFVSFKVGSTEGLSFSLATFGDSNLIQLGQSLISIKGSERNEVATGRITGVSEYGEGEEKGVAYFESDIPVTALGSPAINLKGEIIGISDNGDGNFISINTLKAELEVLTQI